MIKIFSIKEIIDASESILNTTKKNAEPIKNEDKKIVIEEIRKSNSNNPLILTSETKQKKLEIRDPKEIKTTILKKPENIKIDNNLIIDELYKKFNKKIKKSTLKIIIEQQKEINILKEHIKDLRKNDYKNLKINKELKNKILDLTNNEKILNFKISQIQENLNSSSTKIDKLHNINLKLNDDISDLEKSLSTINLTKITLENSNSKLQKKIDHLIDENNRLDKINQTHENDILILTNTKKQLFLENKKLQAELNLINENKEILILNNKKLQKETNLLLKNKELLIEINDKYQNQANNLQVEKDNVQKEKLTLNNNIVELETEKNKIKKINNKLKDQISEFINSENSLLQKTKELESSNNILKNKIETIKSESGVKLLQDMNESLKDEIISLKNHEADLIANNKKLNEELLQVKSFEVSSSHENDLKNLKQKLNFYQDENLRLSHELSNSQKRYKSIKGQLEEIEKEKSNISQKIDDLTDSLSKTSVVTNFFQDTDNSNLNKESKNKVDLEDQVKKIFSNIE